MDYKIHTVDVQNDQQNYIWILEHLPTHEAVVIDPTYADIVKNYCKEHGLLLKEIWLTHWHKDHIGGVPDLLNEQIQVYGPRAELTKIPFITHPLDHDNQIKFHDLKVDIIAVPGHTLGHIVYHINEISTLFCGDTLFAMGCGRVFEGTFEQMYHSLNRLAALPPETKIYCTHEYTLANAKFALHVEPHNLALKTRYEEVERQRFLGQCTLPSQIALELETNPFLRATNLEHFKQLRELKDHF